MIIGSVSMYFETVWDKVEECGFRDNQTFLDYDILVWNPNLLLNEYKEHSEFMGCVSIDSHDSIRILSDIERRLDEMMSLLNMGKNIFIVTPKPQIFYIDTGKREYSGTGKNRHTTRMVDPVNLLSALPIAISTVEAEGKYFEVKGKELFKSFIGSNEGLMKYESYLKEVIGDPFLFIKGTDKVVGTCIDRLNGKIVFIPNVLDPDVFLSDEERNNAEKTFIESIIKLDEELKSKLDSVNLPDWSREYLLPNEPEEKDKISELLMQIELLQVKSEESLERIRDLELYKVLFTGTGVPLEQIVKRIFLELGFEVSEGLPGRDDLILKYKEMVAVVEVKGVGKSAAEKHAAQLEKWVSGYIEKYDATPKGILIVNSYCNLPLAERVEDTFPHQMISYSEKRDHLLISSLQLLGLYIDIQQNPDNKDRLIEGMLSTNGVYPLYKDWSQYLVTSK